MIIFLLFQSSSQTSFLLLLTSYFLLLGRIFLLLLFFLFGSQDLAVGLTSFIEKHSETIVFFLVDEANTEFLELVIFIRVILGSPSPAIVAGLELFELSKVLGLQSVVVEDALVSGISAGQQSHHTGDLVLEQSQLALSSLLPLLVPEAVGLGLELGQFFFMLLASDLSPLG